MATDSIAVFMDTHLSAQSIDLSTLGTHGLKTGKEDEIKPEAQWKRLVPRLLLFVGFGLFFLLCTLKLTREVLGIELPHTLEEIKAIAVRLDDMANTTWSDYVAVATVFAMLYLWQQAFSMPGTVLLNLLSGYLYGVACGTLWTCFLTAVGSTLAYGLAKLVGEPFFELNWVSRRAQSMRRHMKREGKRGLFWWLLFARLFPFSPYWFINMASPFLGVPVAPFFWSTFLGSMPYNLICAQAGIVLAELSSTADIFSFSLILKLLGVSFISLIPIVWGKKIQSVAREYIGLSNVEHRDDAQTDDIEKPTWSRESGRTLDA